MAAALAASACDSGTEVDCLAAEPAAIELQAIDSIPLYRLGDAARITATVENACQRELVFGDSVVWTSSDPTVVTARPITNAPLGEGYVRSISFGSATVSATYRGVTGEIDVDVIEPETDASGFSVLGAGELNGRTTDLWVHGSHAYNGGSDHYLRVWSIGADGTIVRTDSVRLPAHHVNDVKVSADGSFLVASQEGDSAANGIVVMDLANPAAPAIVSHYETDLENGVHNVWIERIDGTDYVFVVEDGGSTGGLHILDVSDRTAPVEVSHYYGGGSSVHDVYVRDGLAFVSHWDLGLVILDVGNGVGGGSPASPTHVGSLVMSGGNTHNAWYWPARELVFVGEERRGDTPEDYGVMHVVDVSDPASPHEVATYGIPGEMPHNFWLDEQAGILYAAWYTRGLRALDVSGALAGNLAAQGIEVGHVVPSGPRGAASVWAPQLHQGVVYLSDVFNGLWSVQLGG